MDAFSKNVYKIFVGIPKISDFEWLALEWYTRIFLAIYAGSHLENSPTSSLDLMQQNLEIT